MNLAKIFKISLFHLSFFFLFSCSSPTENNKVTFSGTVTLADTGDFIPTNDSGQDGVTVSLYKPVEPDTALVRINEKYSNIGVQIQDV